MSGLGDRTLISSSKESLEVGYGMAGSHRCDEGISSKMVANFCFLENNFLVLVTLKERREPISMSRRVRFVVSIPC